MKQLIHIVFKVCEFILMKLPAILICTFLVLFLAFTALMIHYGGYPNIGLPFHYYGEVNRTLREFNKIDGVKVVKQQHNYEDVIEEMGFELTYQDDLRIYIFFLEVVEADKSFDEMYGFYYSDIDRFIRPEDLQTILGVRIENLRDTITHSRLILKNKALLKNKLPEYPATEVYWTDRNFFFLSHLEELENGLR